MTPELYSVLLLGCVAVGLLIADRIYRINPFLIREGFVSGGAYTRCGVDLPPCPFGTRCMNGICANPVQVQRIDRNPLPVLPAKPAVLPGPEPPASTLPATWGIRLSE
jgi:hypothetical protein